MNYIQTEKKDVHFRIISKQLGTNYGILDSHGDLIDIMSGEEITTYDNNILSLFPVKIKYTTNIREAIEYHPRIIEDFESGQWFEVIFENKHWNFELTTGDLFHTSWGNIMDFSGKLTHINYLIREKEMENILRINLLDVHYEIGEI